MWAYLTERSARWNSNAAEELKWLKGHFQPSLNIRYWQEAQTLCRVVSQRLSDAQSQTESLEIKYSKAKRLVREYQGRYLHGHFKFCNCESTITLYINDFICQERRRGVKEKLI